MFFLFGRRSKTKAVRGGRVEKRKCPDCGATAKFVEATKKSTYTAYVAIELLETDDVVFVCSACGEAMDLEDTSPPELSEREKAKALRAAEKDAKKRAKEEAKRKARESREIDDELAALKRRLQGGE